MFLAPAAITAGCAAGIWKGAPIPLLVGGLGITVVAWFGYLTIPYEFGYEAGQPISFQAVVRTVRVAFQDIKSIDARRWNRGFVTLRHTGGSIHLLRQMPGTNELIADIQRRNPSVLIRGSM